MRDAFRIGHAFQSHGFFCPRVRLNKRMHVHARVWRRWRVAYEKNYMRVQEFRGRCKQQSEQNSRCRWSLWYVRMIYPMISRVRCAVLSPSDNRYYFQHSPRCHDHPVLAYVTSSTKAGNVILHLHQCQVRIFVICMRPVPPLKFFLCMESRYIHTYMYIMSSSFVHEDIWYIFTFGSRRVHINSKLEFAHT